MKRNRERLTPRDRLILAEMRLAAAPITVGRLLDATQLSLNTMSESLDRLLHMKLIEIVDLGLPHYAVATATTAEAAHG